MNRKMRRADSAKLRKFVRWAGPLWKAVLDGRVTQHLIDTLSKRHNVSISAVVVTAQKMRDDARA